jgi:hypothetical protein
MAQDGAINIIKEPRNHFINDSGTNLRPDFITNYPIFDKTKPSAFDVSVTNTFSKASNPTEQRIRQKDIKYGGVCIDKGYMFTSLIFETSGKWSNAVTAYIKTCAQQASIRLSIPYHILKHRYDVQLSSILHRANAEMLIHRSASNYAAINGFTRADILSHEYLEEARIL